MNSLRSETAFATPAYPRHEYTHPRYDFNQPRYDFNQPRPGYTTPTFDPPPKAEWESRPEYNKPRSSFPEAKIDPDEIKTSEETGKTVYSLVEKVDDSSTYMPTSKLVYADFNWSEENKDELQTGESIENQTDT